MKQRIIPLAAVIACGLLAASAAHAQAAGTLLLRAGVTRITPNVDSGDLTAPSLGGTQADIRASTRLSGGMTYMLGETQHRILPACPTETLASFPLGIFAIFIRRRIRPNFLRT